jgi:hypothetical protein
MLIVAQLAKKFPTFTDIIVFFYSVHNNITLRNLLSKIECSPYPTLNLIKIYNVVLPSILSSSKVCCHFIISGLHFSSSSAPYSSACCLLCAVFLFGLVLTPENAGDTLFLNSGWFHRHGIISQKIGFFVNSAMRTQSPKYQMITDNNILLMQFAPLRVRMLLLSYN